MSQQDQGPNSQYPYTYIPYENFRDDLYRDVSIASSPEEHRPKAIKNRSHIWNKDTSSAETFILPSIDTQDLRELETFLARRNGSWTDGGRVGHARWLHIEGHVSSNNASCPFVKLLCRSMEQPDVVFCCPRRRDREALSLSSRLVEYEKATHVSFTDHYGCRLHIFRTKSNESITIGRLITLALGEYSKELGERYYTNDPSISRPYNWANENVAIIMCFVIVEHADSNVVCTPRWKVKDMLKPVTSTTNDRSRPQPIGSTEIPDVVKLVSHAPNQLADVCARLLRRQEGPGNQSHQWLTESIRARLENVHFSCTAEIRNNAELIRKDGLKMARIKLETTQEANRIAAAQAHSAVILNILLAILTSLTILSLPFVMMAGYFGMNVFDKASNNTVSKFWKFVGSMTLGFLFAIVSRLIILAKYGPRVHRAITTIFGSGEQTVVNPIVATKLRLQVQDVAPIETGYVARFADQLRRRKTTVKDEEHGTGNSTGGREHYEMTSRAGGSNQRAGEGVV